VKAQESGLLPVAVRSYRAATLEDPAFYEAQYNLGLAASQEGDPRTALAAYENALAIQPDSLPARYNFALLLQQANYPVDAAHEFEKVLVAHPDEIRAHLALGNIYAQQLRQSAKARQQYLKVLDADPHHPQAEAIRSWLTNNPA
jgi:superkiller protein 3